MVTATGQLGLATGNYDPDFIGVIESGGEFVPISDFGYYSRGNSGFYKNLNGVTFYGFRRTFSPYIHMTKWNLDEPVYKTPTMSMELIYSVEDADKGE